MKKNSTWKSCISTKYGLEVRGRFTLNAEGSYWVDLWKAITKEATHLKKNCELVLGYGKRIKYWEDNWCGDTFMCFSP